MSAKFYQAIVGKSSKVFHSSSLRLLILMAICYSFCERMVVSSKNKSFSWDFCKRRVKENYGGGFRNLPAPVPCDVSVREFFSLDFSENESNK